MSAKSEKDREQAGKESAEKLLSRWSRLKQEAKKQPAAGPQFAPGTDPKALPPELPSVDKLTIDSDFRGFFHPKVDEDLRRTALKKLFSNPRFNLMDGLDVYIDDYSKPDPLPAGMLAQLRQAQQIIEWAKEKTEDAGEKAAAPHAEDLPASPTVGGVLETEADMQRVPVSHRATTGPADAEQPNPPPAPPQT